VGNNFTLPELAIRSPEWAFQFHTHIAVFEVTGLLPAAIVVELFGTGSGFGAEPYGCGSTGPQPVDCCFEQRMSDAVRSTQFSLTTVDEVL
jgi:hypothetical protein